MGVRVFVLGLCCFTWTKLFSASETGTPHILTEVVFGTLGPLFMIPSPPLLKLHGKFFFFLHGGVAAKHC